MKVVQILLSFLLVCVYRVFFCYICRLSSGVGVVESYYFWLLIVLFAILFVFCRDSVVERTF